jgi:hypothetical protein
VETVRQDIAAGAPTNMDGTMGLVHFPSQAVGTSLPSVMLPFLSRMGRGLCSGSGVGSTAANFSSSAVDV